MFQNARFQVKLWQLLVFIAITSICSYVHKIHKISARHYKLMMIFRSCENSSISISDSYSQIYNTKMQQIVHRIRQADKSLSAQDCDRIARLSRDAEDAMDDLRESQQEAKQAEWYGKMAKIHEYIYMNPWMTIKKEGIPKPP